MSVQKNKEDFAREALNISQLFFGLTHALTKAGEKALLKANVQSATNSLCVLPMGIPGITRRIIPLGLTIQSPIPPVHFDHRSITVVGGSAVQLYAFTNGPKNSNYVPTTDIDAVWWPKIMLPPMKERVKDAVLVDPTSDKYEYITQSRNPTPENNSPNAKEPFRYAYSYETGSNRVRITSESKGILTDADNYAVLSSSWAIQALVIEYTKSLQKELVEFAKKYEEALRILSEKIFGIKNPKISASAKYENIFQAGIANIWGYIVIQPPDGTKVSVKLIEMTIHDGASSQRSNTLEESTKDIIYSIFKTTPDAITPFIIENTGIPKISRLLDQQMFTLQFRKDEKLDTTLRRMKFLYGILSDAEKAAYKPKLEALCTKKEYAFLCAPATPLLPLPIPETIKPGYAAAPMPAPPAYTAPGYAAPGYAAPAYTAPGYAAPGYAMPDYAAGMGAPGYAAPGYAAPGYAAPGYAAPGYAAPGYAAPGYAAGMGAPGYAADMGAPRYAGHGTPFHPYGKPKQNPRGKQGGKITRRHTMRSRKKTRRA